MKNRALWLAVLAAIIISFTVNAQDVRRLGPVKFERLDLGGPRLGLTYVPGNTPLARQLKDNRMDRFLSQFGWHFEYKVVPEGGGPSFLIEFIPLLAGVEYGTLISSATLAMGVRFPDGYEFGMGPNVIVTTDGPKTALVVAIGRSLDYGGVSIPLNRVLTKNPEGLRTSFIFGYAITQ